MARAIAVNDGYGKLRGYLVMCPACGHGHLFNTEQPTAKGAKWSFNGNLDKPTFSPSMHVTVEPPGKPRRTLCHSFVTDGRIQYLADSAHAMKGQTVDLPEINKSDLE